MDQLVAIIGGGLAGSELAFQLAEKGVSVALYEQRLLTDYKFNGAHQSKDLAELVCSNSLRSNCMHSAAGLLKKELRILGSFLISNADLFSVPAGSALAVSREDFSKKITQVLLSHKNIKVIAEQISEIDLLLHKHKYVVIATGPVTSLIFAEKIKKIIGDDYLYFYDAIAPIIEADSVNMNICFKANRYNFEEGEDYINVPLNKEQYFAFVEELKKGEKVSIHEGDKDQFFRGCLPIEVMALDNDNTLLHGPLRGDGLINPSTGSSPFAAVQLRQENVSASMYNMVGFQTRLKYSEQERIFKLLPGLEDAVFYRLGSMHRNTFINAPKSLSKDMSLKNNDRIFIAGQLSGVEGYIESISHAMIVAKKLLYKLNIVDNEEFPEVSAVGSLGRYLLFADPKNFQPMKVNFGLLPPLTDDSKKRFLRGKNRYEHRLAYSRRSIFALNVNITF